MQGVYGDNGKFSGNPLKKRMFLCRVVTYAVVAQSVEQLPFKEMVVGSIPTEGT